MARSADLLPVGVVLLLVSSLAGCDVKHSVASSTPTAPTASLPPVPVPEPEPPVYTTITGRVFVHGVRGVTPLSGAVVQGWMEVTRNGQANGRHGTVLTDATGGFSLAVWQNALLRLQALREDVYQPCTVTFTMRGEARQDLHVISDVRQLGAALPAEMLAASPLLTGVVYERTANGRQPIADAEVGLDAYGGMGVPVARSRTDDHGRYVFCGLGGETTTSLYAGKDGYKANWTFVRLTGGDTTVDVELTR